MMERSAYESLLKWKKNKKRKPLILQGARQVGKTYLVDMFGKAEYKDYIQLNFEKDQDLQSLFTQSLDPEVIIDNLSLYIGRKINYVDTLLFFDEIQIAPEVLSSLKYFQEKAPQYHIIAAGSLLGVSVGKESSFPVGKVNFLTLFPMSFKEYLLALGEDVLVRKLETIQDPQPLPDAIHNKLLKLQKMYLYLGGMPEVIQDYIDHDDIASVRLIQNEILEAYKRDFSKYAEKGQAIKTSEVWNSIPRQLAKENKKFKYSDVKKNARASMFDQAIEWLHKTGLIHIVNNVKTPKLPLSSYADYSKFKVYLNDVGLLAAELNISSEQIISPTRLFSEFNGALIENFIAQELRYFRFEKLFYWTSRSDAEVDFLLERSQDIYPLEVKSGMSRNIKSLRSYAEKYKPGLLFRISPRNFAQSDDFINIPIYATNTLMTLLPDKNP